MVIIKSKAIIEKEKQLGMTLGKANYKLDKIVMFNLAKKLNMTNCFRCKKTIVNLEDFSIDHKNDWLYSDNPISLFFDVTNISFSHLRCNVRKMQTKKGMGLDKSEVLGANISTANYHLRKKITYYLASLCDMLVCHRCNKNINELDDFTKDHIGDWLHSENPVLLFFDFNNITFSHHICNSKASGLSEKGRIELSNSVKNRKRIIGEKGTNWCSLGKHFAPIGCFGSDKSRWNKLDNKCKECKRKYRQNQRKLVNKEEKKSPKCRFCNIPIGKTSVNNLCRRCNMTFFNKKRANENKPSKEKLPFDFVNLTDKQLENKYKVSSSTIRRWLVRYNLPTSRRKMKSFLRA